MTNDEKIAMALEQALRDDIAEYEKLPDHKFSCGFDRKMKRLFQDGLARERHTSCARVRKKLPAAVIVVISVFLITGAAATTYVLWNNFRLESRGLYTLLNITDVENCPTTLEGRYRLTADLSGFTENILSDDEILYFVEYENKEKNIKISFQQGTKRGTAMALNTEDMSSPIEVTVNDCNGIYYETKYGTHVFIWDTGDYFIDLEGTGIGQNDLLSLAKFVQKVE